MTSLDTDHDAAAVADGDVAARAHRDAAPRGPGAAPARAPGDPLDLVLGHLRAIAAADAALLLTVDRDRTSIEPLACWFSCAQLEEAVAPSLSRPYERRRPWLVEAAIERGRPLLLPRLEDWEGTGRVRPGAIGGAGAWELLRHASALACPVRTPLGRTVGALVVLALDPRRPLGGSDLDVATVAADLAAVARERSALLAAEAARGRTELLLKRAAEATAGTLERHEVERRVVEHAVRIAAADHGRLSRVRRGSRRLLAVGGEGAHAVLDAGDVADVARSREPRTVGGERPSVHVPIELGPRLFGVLSLVRERPREFDRDDLAVVLRLARIAAAALANAHDFEHERRLARTLTHGFVPESLPPSPGWDVGLLYEPADDQPTGGDLYGAWPAAGGELCVLVGDVAGKGVETAALSAMARFFVEARSWDCADPARVLEQASAMLAARLPDDRFATAFFGFLGERRLRYVNAGHLAPLVVHAGGGLSEARVGGLPLGIGDRPAYVVHELELEPDDVLLAFTDGVVEARREGRLLGDAGLRGIVADAAAATREPQALAELVHDGVRAWASGLADDAAVLALRRRAG